MTTWTQNPALIAKLRDYEANPTPARRRRLAIVGVLERRGFTPWPGLVHWVERELGEGGFGQSPHSRVLSDIRALRDAGVAIGYSRRKGAEGYYLGLESVREDIQTVIRQVFRELDFEHLRRIKQVSPDRRVEGVFELIDFAQQISEAGKRARMSEES
jgi:hypothetical protein